MTMNQNNKGHNDITVIKSNNLFKRLLNNGHDISNSKLGFLATVNKLASIHAFSGNKKFLPGL